MGPPAAQRAKFDEILSKATQRNAKRNDAKPSIAPQSDAKKSDATLSETKQSIATQSEAK